MVKQTNGKKRGPTTAINIGYSWVLAIGAMVLLGLYLVRDPDVMVELSVGLGLGAVVSSVLGSILKKPLVVTLLITTGIFLVAGLMILMQMDLSRL